ncbi:DHA2 family efflux MFS transporter permease subunit [Bdellovibrionota bacterium FG-2]
MSPIAQHLKNNPRYKWDVLGIVMIGTLMAALDTSIVNVSIPSIMADFGVGVDDIEWVVTGYMLAFAVLMPLTAWLRDVIGSRRLYVLSLFVFTLGSVLCGMAWNLPSLIIARVVQALGGGALTPVGMSMITEVFEPRERGKAMGYWGVGVIMGPALGPTLGGILTKSFGWRSIFLVNIPIGIIGILLALRILIPDKPHASEKRAFDFWGFGFLSTFLVAFLLGVSNGEHEGWNSVYVAVCAIISFFSLIGFFLVESLVPNGIIDLSLFKSSVLSIATLVTFVRSVALFGGVFLLPLFLQRQMGFDEIESGLLMMPGALAVAFTMPIAGKLSDRVGARGPAVFGLCAVAYSMLMYRNIDITTSLWNVISPTLMRGVGMGFLMAPVMATAMNAVPRNKAGTTSSMLNLIQQVGGAIGIAFLATVLGHRIHFHMSVASSAMHVGSPAMFDAVRRVAGHAHLFGLTRGQAFLAAKMAVAQHLGVAATVSSFQDAFMVGSAIVAVAIVPTLFLPNKSVGDGAGAKPEGLYLE